MEMLMSRGVHETLMSVLMASKFHEYIHERSWKLKVSWAFSWELMIGWQFHEHFRERSWLVAIPWAFSWALIEIVIYMSIFMSAHDWLAIPWAFSWVLMEIVNYMSITWALVNNHEVVYELITWAYISWAVSWARDFIGWKGQRCLWQSSGHHISGM